VAFSFDEVDDRVTLADDAALTLPNGDWSLGGWVKLTDNAGTTFQYFISWGTFDANPSLSFYFVEASNGTDPNKLTAVVNDGSVSVNAWRVLSSTTPGTSTAWQHVALVRSGATITMYVDGASVGSDTATTPAGTDVAGSLFLGARADLSAGRFFGGSMAEFAKWDRALAAGELAALANGFSPLCLPGSLRWYMPMVRNYTETVAAIAVTNTGSTVALHPRIFSPAAPLIVTAPAPTPAAGGSIIIDPRAGRGMQRPVARTWRG
jgi:hypothetical protein